LLAFSPRDDVSFQQQVSTQVFVGNGNPPPFPSYPYPAAAAPAPAPVTAPPVAPPAGNPNPFGTKSLEFTGGNDPNMKNYKKLGQALMEADTERRKDSEAAANREREAEMRREERRRKIQYMQEMPDNQPAGTGKSFSSPAPVA
jgi:hypothetical protein